MTSFINSKPLPLDTLFPYKITCPVLNLYPNCNVFQWTLFHWNHIRFFLLKTVNLIGQFSLFIPIIALICVSHKTNFDNSQAIFLIYMGTSSLPPTHNSVPSFIPSSCQVLSHSSSLLAQLSGKKTHIFINITYALWQLSTLKGPTEVHFTFFSLKKDAIAILKNCLAIAVLKNSLLPLKNHTHYFSLFLLKTPQKNYQFMFKKIKAILSLQFKRKKWNNETRTKDLLQSNLFGSTIYVTGAGIELLPKINHHYFNTMHYWVKKSVH